MSGFVNTGEVMAFHILSPRQKYNNFDLTEYFK